MDRADSEKGTECPGSHRKGERKGIDYVCREYDVQTDDVANANARRLREVSA